MSKGPCPHCVEIDCYKHCYDDADGKHEVDPTSASSMDGKDANGRILVDFRCRRCGVEGAIAVDPKKINWD